MNIVQRAKNLLLTPATEWDAIAAETHSVKGLYTGWVMVLAAIPAVAGFIGQSIVGVGVFGVAARTPVGNGLVAMVASYLLTLVMVLVFALVIDEVAPRFGGRKDFKRAFKVAAFTPTATWLAGAFSVMPGLSILTLLGLYSLYLLWVGLPRLMEVPPEKGPMCTIVTLLAMFVLALVIGTGTALLGLGRVAY